MCDGKDDCDDRSDEQGCSLTLLSSDTDMIDNLVSQSAYWIIGFLIILGNLVVIVSNLTDLKTGDLTGLLRCQHVIILSISIADFIMGIYLLTIVVSSQKYSGIYKSVDVEWRTSLSCSIVGSLAVVSSEASCFLMVVLSIQRLHTLSKVFASITSCISPWKIAVFLVWFTAVTF